MADSPVGRIYATVGFESTIAADLAKINAEIVAGESKLEASARNISSSVSSIGTSATAAAEGVRGLTVSIAEMVAASQTFRSTGIPTYVGEFAVALGLMDSTTKGTTISIDELLVACETFRSTGLPAYVGEFSAALIAMAAAAKTATISISELIAAGAGFRSGGELQYFREFAPAVSLMDSTLKASTLSWNEMVAASAGFRNSGVTQYVREFATVGSLMESTAKASGQSLVELENTATNSLQNINEIFKSLLSTVNLFKTGFTALPAYIGVKIGEMGLGMAVTYQDASVTLENMYSNGEKAKEIIQELIKVAVETPYTFEQLQNMAVQLKAMGLEVQDYQDAILNTASATGKTVDEVTRNFVSSSMGYFRNLRQFGIEAWVVTNQNYEKFGLGAEAVGKEMLSYYNKYGQQVVTTVDRYNQQAIASTVSMILNDKYVGAMETRSQTLTGLYSTLTDNIQQFLGQLVGFQVVGEGMDAVEIRTLSLANALIQLEKVGIAISKVFVEMPGWALDGAAAFGALIVAGSAWVTVSGLITAANALMIKSFGEAAAAGFIASLVTGVGEVVAVGAIIGLLVADLSKLQETFGVLNPFIEFFNAQITVLKDRFSGGSVIEEERTRWDDFKEGIDGVSQSIDTFLEKHQLLNAALEELKRQLGVNHFENLIEGIKNYASTTEEKASEIDASNRMWAKSAEEAGIKYTDVAGSVGISYNQMDSEVGSAASGVVGANDDIGASAEKMADRVKNSVNNAIAEYKNQLSMISSLNATGFPISQNPTQAQDVRKYFSTDKEITSMSDKLTDALDKKADLYEKYEDTTKSDARALSSIRDDIKDQAELVSKLTSEGVEGNSEVLNMERSITKAKKDLVDLYDDSAIVDAKEKLSELYDTSSIDKAKRDLQEIYADTSVQDAKEKLSELYDTSAIDKAKRDLQKLYNDTSIKDAKEKLTELYSTEDIDKAKKQLQELYADTSAIDDAREKLQELYADDSIQNAKEDLQKLYDDSDIVKERQQLQKLFADNSIAKEKEKLTELYSTEDIDKAKKDLQKLYSDDSILKEKEKLTELYSTEDIDKEKAKLADLQGDLRNNKEYVANAKRLIEEELANLQPVFDKYALDASLGGQGSQEKLIEVTDRINELKRQLAQLSSGGTGSQAYLLQLKDELGQATQQAEDARIRMLENETPDAITAYIDAQNKVLDVQKQIAESKTSPAPDIVTDINTQIQDQQDKITQMQTDQAKAISDQLEKVAQMEADLVQKKADQQEKIAQMEEERIKRIQEQQEKITQMEVDHAQDIADKQDKILQMEMDRAEKINDQQEKIAKLEQERVKNIQDQQEKIAKLEQDRQNKIIEQQEKIAKLEEERVKRIQDQEEKIAKMGAEQAEKIAEQKEKIVKMEADRAKDIQDQKEKIAKMEKDQAEKIADQKEKIAKMEADRSKDIADQKEKIAKMEKEQAEKIAEKQDQIVQLEKNLAEKKKDIDEKIKNAEEKLVELKTKYQETQDKQAEQRTELINQIAEQDKTIAKLQNDISKLQAENATRKEKIFSPENAATLPENADEKIKLMGGGVNKNLPDGGLMYYDPKKGMKVIDDLKGNYDSIRTLYEWGYKNNDMIYSQDKAYKVLDSSLTNFSENAEAAYRDQANGGATLLTFDSKRTKELVQQQGILNSLNPTAEGFYGNMTKVGKENFSIPASGMKLYWKNTGEAVLMFKDLNTWQENVEKMSTAEAVTQLGYLVQTGQVGKEKAAELLKTILHLNGVKLTDAQNQIGVYGDKSKESSEKVGFISSAVDWLTGKGKAVGSFALDMIGIGTASASTSTEIGNAATSTDTFNNKSLDNAKSQATGIKNEYGEATGKIGDTATGIDTVNGMSTGNAQTQGALLRAEYDKATVPIGNTKTGLENINNTKMTDIQTDTGLIGTILDTVRNNSIVSFISSGLAKVNSFRHTDLQNDTGLIGTIYDSVKNSKIVSFINDGLTRVNNFKHPLLQTDIGLIGTVYDTVKNSKIASFINDGLSKVNIFKHTNLQNDTTLIGTIYDTVKNSKISTFISDGLAKVNSFKHTELKSDITSIGTVSDEVKKKLGSFWQGVKDGVKQSINDLWSPVTGGDSAKAGEGTANAFATGASSASTNSSNAGVKIANSFASGADSNKQGATNTGTNAGNSFINGVQSTVTNSYNSGVNLVTNFRNGVESQGVALKQTMQNWASTIASYVPHSPAKVGALSVLPNWDAFLYDPIQNSLDKAKSLIPSVAQTLKDITTPIQAVAPAINSSFNSIGIQKSQMPAYPSSNGSVAKMVQTTMYNVNHNVKAGTINYNGSTLQTKRLQSVI